MHIDWLKFSQQPAFCFVCLSVVCVVFIGLTPTARERLLNVSLLGHNLKFCVCGKMSLNFYVSV